MSEVRFFSGSADGSSPRKGWKAEYILVGPRVSDSRAGWPFPLEHETKKEVPCSIAHSAGPA